MKYDKVIITLDGTPFGDPIVFNEVTGPLKPPSNTNVIRRKKRFGRNISRGTKKKTNHLSDTATTPVTLTAPVHSPQTDAQLKRRIREDSAIKSRQMEQIAELRETVSVSESRVEEKAAHLKNAVCKHNVLVLEHSNDKNKLKTKYILDINTKNRMIETLREHSRSNEESGKLVSACFNLIIPIKRFEIFKLTNVFVPNF